jgi:hypothetical protein
MKGVADELINDGIGLLLPLAPVAAVVASPMCPYCVPELK